MVRPFCSCLISQTKEKVSPGSLFVSSHPTPSQPETIFPNPRRHPETDGFYQAGMTSLDLPRMVELVLAIVGLCSAGIFLALAMDAYKAESEGPKDSQPEA